MRFLVGRLQKEDGRPPLRGAPTFGLNKLDHYTIWIILVAISRTTFHVDNQRINIIVVVAKDAYIQSGVLPPWESVTDSFAPERIGYGSGEEIENHEHASNYS